MIVRIVLEAADISYEGIDLGRVKLVEALTPQKRAELDSSLKYYELELMEHSKKILVERIKIAIIEMFHSAEDKKPFKFSEELSNKLKYDYTYLANTFSEMEKSTIEKFYISKKVERVKQLIVDEGMSIKEISYHLNYSSVPHLCKQFKMVTGITPAKFRSLWESEKYVE